MFKDEKYKSSIMMTLSSFNIDYLKEVIGIATCETGFLTKKLFKDFKLVHGIDISEEMISKNKNLFLGNMKDFDLGKKYDLVLCTFDSLNYNLTEKDLKKSFSNFKKHLKEGER